MEPGPLTTNEEQQGPHNDLVKGVVDSNFKNMAELPTQFANLVLSNSIASNDRRAQAADAAHALILNRMATTDPAEAVSQRMLANAGLPTTISDNGAAASASSVLQANGQATILSTLQSIQTGMAALAAAVSKIQA